MNELHDLLERATDRIESPDLAVRALAGARRRRTTRRGVAAAGAAAVLVLVVALAGQLTRGDDDTAPPVSPSPTPSGDTVSTAPAIAAGRIQPVWDPRGAESLPVADLGVPRVMESLSSGAVTRPVAVLDDGERARLVSADGLAADLPLPDGLGRWRTVSLSPDGTRLAAVGISGFFWRTLVGDWQRVGLDDEDQVTGEGIEITWSPDGSSLVLRSHLAGVQVDLDTGEQTRLPMLRNYASWDFAPDGTVVTTGLPGVRGWDDREVSRETLLGPVENLQRPVVGETSIVAARGNTSWPDERQPDDYDGLIALDRESLETRGFLRVPDQVGYYVDGGVLTPVAWVDDDTVAFTVLPKDAPKEYLLTWDVETGEVSRVSCWDRSYDAVFATDLLAGS
jgi:hypothetical protein